MCNTDQRMLSKINYSHIEYVILSEWGGVWGIDLSQSLKKMFVNKYVNSQGIWVNYPFKESVMWSHKKNRLHKIVTPRKYVKAIAEVI